MIDYSSLSNFWNWVSENVKFIIAFIIALAPIIAILLSARSIFQQACAVDVSNYFEIIKQLSEHQRRMKNCSSMEERKFEFYEFLNLLETISHLYNAKRFGMYTKRMAKKFLVESLAEIETSHSTRRLMLEAVSSPNTFSEIALFCRNFRREIDKYKHERHQSSQINFETSLKDGSIVDVANQAFIQEQDLQFIKEAKNFLEHSSFLTELMNNYVGKPVDIIFENLPSNARDAISRGTSKALQKALELALMTIGEEAKDSRGQILRNIHTISAAITGAVSGAFGMPALVVEIPITTMIILRSIATTAIQNGEDLAEVHNRLECIEVFTLGSNKTSSDNEIDSVYLTQRAAFAKLANEAAKYISRLSTTQVVSAIGSSTTPQVTRLMAPQVTRLLGNVAPRFQIVLSEKYLAQMIPVLGAIGGASINAYFAQYFGRAAHYHFGIRRLERQYGHDTIAKVYKAS